MKFFKSFLYAFQGIGIGLGERNMRIHLVAAAVAIGLSLYFQISKLEWLLVIGCIGFVITTELMNTAIEKLCNALLLHNRELHRSLGAPKDVAAGAVLIASLTALVIGCLIFIPHLLISISLLLQQ